MSSSPARATETSDHLERLRTELSGRDLLVFLDYDGTLCPIVAHPEDAVMAAATRAALDRLAHRHTTAIVSGRALEDVRARVGLEQLYYAGNHGFEIEGPTGSGMSKRFGEEFRDDLAGAASLLSQRLNTIPGVLVENKGYTLSVHYRQTPEADRPSVDSAVEEAVDAYPRLRKHGGKLIYEIRPHLDWHKGRAVAWLRDRIRPNAFALYVGDDLTDEDAFRALSDSGLGILVSKEARPTAADFRIGGVEEVRTLLSALADIE